MSLRTLLTLGTLLVGFASCTTEPAPRAEGPEPAAATLGALRAQFPHASLAAAATPRALRVAVPEDARGEIALEDPASRVGARIALEGARPSRREDAEGVAVYREAGVVVRTTELGVEDHVLFPTKPEREEARYVLTPSEGTRLRLLANVLELVDADGTPRLRMSAPWVESRGGSRVEAQASIEGCAFDADPAPPWGRALPLPGASRCTLVVRWSGATYPALLDPNWTTTVGTLVQPRFNHTAVKLANGRVLIVYGDRCLDRNSCGVPSPATPELYDPATRTFAAVGVTFPDPPDDRVSRTPGVLLPNGKALVLSTTGGLLFTTATGKFTTTGTSTIKRSGGSTLTLLANGKVLAAGGSANAQVEIYDPVADTFTLGPALKTNRTNHTATLLANGKVLLAGGGTTTAELYDPVANTTTLTGAMTTARTSHAAARLGNGKVLLVSGAATAVADLYDPGTGTFSATGSTSEVRDDLDAVALPSGNAYVVAGLFPGAISASVVVERFDPATGKFDLAPFLLRGRHKHRVILLDDGSLLATGGLDARSAELTVPEAEVLSLAAPGTACTRGDDCATGICDLGICCAAACNDACRSCSAGTGACDAVKGKDDPSSCTGASTCDATGACKKKAGQTCGAQGECASGACVDGFCCDRACDGACEACNGLVPGRCDAVAGAPRGKRTCPSDGSICGGACDGTTRDRCAFPAESTGCGTSCEGSTLTAGSCDGKGACGVKTARPCAGNLACESGESCRTRCTKNDECARGFGCTPEGKCTPIAACDGDHTIVGADGKSKTDCTPYRCAAETNLCRTSCTDVSGCASPFVCDFDGRCIAPPAAAAGCSASPARAVGSPAGVLAVVLALVAASRRRRLLW